MNEQLEASLTGLNTFSLPCVAKKLISFDSATEVPEFFEKTNVSQDEYIVLGGGSNVVLPEYLDKTVLRFMFDATAYSRSSEGGILVEVEAGREWDDLVAETVSKGYVGLENLSYIPGTVGAAPVQNIGAYGVELSDVLESVCVFDTVEQSIYRLDNKQCQFAYRDSLFKRSPKRFCILSISLRLSEDTGFRLQYGELKSLQALGDRLTVSAVREKVIEVRQSKLPEPKELPNVGSFFKNPVVSAEDVVCLKNRFPDIVSYDLGGGEAKLAAGWLIDRAGWKGATKGRVGVHKKQALVLINLGGARQADVLALATDIQDSVQSMFSVRLEMEPLKLLPK